MTQAAPESLDKQLDHLVFEAGQIIFEEGDKSETAFIIRSGSVRIVKRNQTGDVVLVTLTAPKAFGELSLIDNTPRSAAAIAAERTELMVITADKFKAKIAGLDPFMRDWVLFLKHRILDLSARVED
ncbi:cAMP-binding protein [Paramagnetospirillum magnetotacticum MS-1]|uniref:cAMP-binding protein n=1 Tax=Paramagnetospirillum magnetotacticum MS-1 TaxID=272627 RepID=A0A0C2YYK6_PARME|nr:cyclic nucleotide-binding domain-containing protein [Paramagnetospirillum magnetotacticum]KIM00159.1 cAMP-binding protein [Paramagnetospirillum magnetotacticum MS-1]